MSEETEPYEGVQTGQEPPMTLEEAHAAACEQLSHDRNALMDVLKHLSGTIEPETLMEMAEALTNIASNMHFAVHVDLGLALKTAKSRIADLEGLKDHA